MRTAKPSYHQVRLVKQKHIMASLHFKIYLFIALAFFSTHSLADVITCGDAMSVGKEAKISLHEKAQQRAKKAVEAFTDKQLAKPYVAAGGFDPVCGSKKCKMEGTLETTADLVETFWCETASTPLHSAYYRLYTSSKDFYDTRYIK